MKDKKTIWHEPGERPELGKLFIVLNSYGIISTHTIYKNAKALNHIKKWCYLDDLLELSNKVENLESEVSRYKNALKCAEGHLEYIGLGTSPKTNCEIDLVARAKTALKEINSIKGE